MGFKRSAWVILSMCWSCAVDANFHNIHLVFKWSDLIRKAYLPVVPELLMRIDCSLAGCRVLDDLLLCLGLIWLLCFCGLSAAMCVILVGAWTCLNVSVSG